MNVSEAVGAEKNRWNAFVAQSPYKSFMQTWAWGQLQEYMHVPCFRLVIEDAGKIVAVALVVERALKMGYGWLCIPRGPIFLEGLSDKDKESAWQVLVEKLKILGDERDAFFIRIDPIQESFAQQGWRKSPREVQPQHTLILNLSSSEEELLAGMHSKTRYNIKVAERKNVTVRFSNSAEDVRAFLDASQSVTGRTGFSYHSDEYYRGIVEVLGKENLPDRQAGMAELAIAELGGQVAAVHLMIYADGIATYAHGASKNEFRSSMAPALLYWKTILRAKEKGMQQYDFFGVAPENAPEDHSWNGITRMKIGFGGTRVSYAGAYDLVFNEALYTMFNLTRKAKQIIKNGLV